MKSKFNFLSIHEIYLLSGLSVVIVIALLPLVLDFSLSFEFAIFYWSMVIVLAVIFASFILFRQNKEMRSSEKQIRIYSKMIKNLKKYRNL
ncbi:hypothetical protein [Thermoflexibacter ruber]|uniref:Uncharacterized protein n=1 Tax=Thermoflexibacter ruber TaxID=1003 RepID=A0A1I2AYP6_9BACT|nr:hypothetical protein [Thermoflexibacter ruber]SFE49064.1 hypothetical protein SAMN04488541_100268 [Thermoflexibacter ruber]